VDSGRGGWAEVGRVRRVSVVVGAACAAAGAVVGPFLAGLTLRVPAEEPLLTAGAWRGRPAAARRVGVVTVLTAAVLGTVGSARGAEPELAAYLWLAAIGITLAVIDLDCLRLPDRLTLPSYPIGVALLALASTDDWSALRRALLAAVVVGGAAFLLALLVPGGGLGLGDVKLLGLLGLFLGWLGWGEVALGIAAGFAIGAVAAVVLLALRRAGLKDHMAFGQWLIAGALVAVVAGDRLLDAYLAVGTAGSGMGP
jgi:leader peptidase (prepilin peptidase) / N-methyltransferase